MHYIRIYVVSHVVFVKMLFQNPDIKNGIKSAKPLCFQKRQFTHDLYSINIQKYAHRKNIIVMGNVNMSVVLLY